MSDLTRFRDHCRAMAATPDAAPVQPTPDQRELWTRLADEVDAYLDRHREVVTVDLLAGDQAMFEVPC